MHFFQVISEEPSRYTGKMCVMRFVHLMGAQRVTDVHLGICLVYFEAHLSPLGFRLIYIVGTADVTSYKCKRGTNTSRQLVFFITS